MVAEQVREATGLALEVVKRPGISRGFIPVSWRWIGERTFGWFNRWRRSSKDYERHEDAAETIDLRWDDRARGQATFRGVAVGHALRGKAIRDQDGRWMGAGFIRARSMALLCARLGLENCTASRCVSRSGARGETSTAAPERISHASHRARHLTERSISSSEASHRRHPLTASRPRAAAQQRPRDAQIGIGALGIPQVPCHTTRHAGPHRAVRRVEVTRRASARRGRRSS